MPKFIPYERAKNYAKYRCNSAIVKFDHDDVYSECGAVATITEHLADSKGAWTASWNRHSNELTVYSRDTTVLSYVAMLSK